MEWQTYLRLTRQKYAVIWPLLCSATMARFDDVYNVLIRFIKFSMETLWRRCIVSSEMVFNCTHQTLIDIETHGHKHAKTHAARMI